MTISASLDKAQYQPGEMMYLTVDAVTPGSSSILVDVRVEVAGSVQTSTFAHPAGRLTLVDAMQSWGLVARDGDRWVFASPAGEQSGSVVTRLDTLDGPQTASAAYTVVAAVAGMPFLIGMTSPISGGQHDAMVARWPGLRYTVDFGDDNDGDDMPELLPWMSGKQANFPGAPARVSRGWKDTVSQLSTILTNAPAGAPPGDLVFHHEPHGDAGMTPAIHRARNVEVRNILDSHPRADELVTLWGSCVTRYYLAHGGTWTDWFVDGMTCVWVDSYNSDNSTRYWTPEEQFRATVDFARSKGIRWGVRETGFKRLSGDTTGSRRADHMVASAEWAASQGDCVCWTYWNNGATASTSRILGVSGIDTTPEQQAIDYLVSTFNV